MEGRKGKSPQAPSPLFPFPSPSPSVSFTLSLSSRFLFFKFLIEQFFFVCLFHPSLFLSPEGNALVTQWSNARHAALLIPRLLSTTADTLLLILSLSLSLSFSCTSTNTFLHQFVFEQVKLEPVYYQFILRDCVRSWSVMRQGFRICSFTEKHLSDNFFVSLTLVVKAQFPIRRSVKQCRWGCQFITQQRVGDASIL